VREALPHAVPRLVRRSSPEPTLRCLPFARPSLAPGYARSRRPGVPDPLAEQGGPGDERSADFPAGHFHVRGGVLRAGRAAGPALPAAAAEPASKGLPLLPSATRSFVAILGIPGQPERTVVFWCNAFPCVRLSVVLASLICYRLLFLECVCGVSSTRRSFWGFLAYSLEIVGEQ
jgi:hypothetical protein